MDVLPLPPRPDFEQYRKLAKDLVAATRADDAGDAVRVWARGWLESLARALETPITPFVRDSMDRAVEHIASRVRDERATRPRGARFRLADAHFLIANAHGFPHWAAFEQHVRRASGDGTERDPFEAAADAIVGGDLATLAEILRRQPALVRARSARVHGATLLHYIAANGVEDFRQKTPPNAVPIARALLDAGAEVDALANTYSGGWWQTTLNLLVSSAHPAEAGLQCALVDVLVDFGAAVHGVKNDQSPIMTALAFGYLDAAETLVRRGARVDNVLTAAALGRADLLGSFVLDAGTLRPGVPLVAPGWLRLPDRADTHLAHALVWACRFGGVEAAAFLLETGVDPAAADGSAMTCLHHAAARGDTALIRLLLEHGAPLEAVNQWGGTVLDSTGWFAMNNPAAGVDYAAVMEMLIAAGADVNAAFPTGDAVLDAMLRRHGAGG